jgi:hypothetical protein
MSICPKVLGPRSIPFAGARLPVYLPQISVSPTHLSRLSPPISKGGSATAANDQLRSELVFPPLVPLPPFIRIALGFGRGLLGNVVAFRGAAGDRSQTSHRRRLIVGDGLTWRRFLVRDNWHVRAYCVWREANVCDRRCRTATECRHNARDGQQSLATHVPSPSPLFLDPSICAIEGLQSWVLEQQLNFEPSLHECHS